MRRFYTIMIAATLASTCVQAREQAAYYFEGCRKTYADASNLTMGKIDRMCRCMTNVMMENLTSKEFSAYGEKWDTVHVKAFNACKSE